MNKGEPIDWDKLIREEERKRDANYDPALRWNTFGNQKQTKETKNFVSLVTFCLSIHGIIPRFRSIASIALSIA